MRKTFLHPLALLLLLHPLACKQEKKPEEALALANRVSQRTVSLFFESNDLVLVPEQRVLSLPENDAAALSAVLRELFKGSANASIPKVLPADILLRGAYLLPEGTAIVDIGGPTLVSGWNTGSHAESSGIYSIVQTLTANFKNVKRVRILVNGQSAETLAGHVDLQRSLRPLSASMAVR